MYTCILFVYFIKIIKNTFLVIINLPSLSPPISLPFFHMCPLSPILNILSSLHLSPPLSIVLTIAVANKHPVIILPTDHIKIFSSTWPDSSSGVTYHYHWRRLFGPKKGNLNGVNDKTISLSHVCYREGGESTQCMYMPISGSRRYLEALGLETHEVCHDYDHAHFWHCKMINILS